MNEEITLAERSAREVFEDHLELARQGDLQKDLERNVSEEIVLLTNFGIFRGHKGVREAARLLAEEIPDADFDYKSKLCHDKICFLEWTGDSANTFVDNGADSFYIEAGKIRVQTIFYTVKKK